MRCGVMVDHGTIPLPNYWPRPDIAKMNNAVWSLKIEYRNFFVSYYVLSVKEPTIIAGNCGVGRDTIWRWLKDKYNSPPYNKLANAYILTNT